MPNDSEILRLIGTLSLREKAALCSGADFWTTKPIPSKGIPSMRMADGPHGLRFEDQKNRHIHGGHSHRATCFPPEVALACSFSPALTREVGRAIAEECISEGVHMILGPGVNIKRSPLGGRNFEYYSEDPLLSGEMAAGFIEGVQGMGVGTSLKHYAVNNQESYRMCTSAAVDERALRDIYLRAFEIAVKKAKPATVMASYNKVNGIYATENRALLTQLLRIEFGFEGVVVSDWSAVSDRVAGIAAGMDLEMPSSGGVNDLAIERAVESGALSEDALDVACWNVLRMVFRYAKPESHIRPCNYFDNHELAVTALTKSAVLLKNNGMLPLDEKQPVLVIGEMADKPHYQGGGSSVINPKRLVSFLDTLRIENLPHSYQPGYQGTHPQEILLRDAVNAAKKAERVLLFLGLPDSYECEAFDRTTLRLPDNQIALLEAVVAVNPNTCVLLCSGAPIEAPWLDTIASLLCLHLGGEGIGEGALRLVYGRANPSGKLAESWPLTLADAPCHHWFPMGHREVRYNESIYVGYRYYDTAQKPVLFPFGYGLSYTTFEYSDLTLEQDVLETGAPCRLSFTIKNTGSVAGEEIAQIYAARKSSALHQPAHELAGFTRVPLAPGEEKRVEAEIPYEEFGVFEASLHGRAVESGLVEIQVGPSSRELPLRADLDVRGVTIAPEEIRSAKGPYGDIRDNRFPEEDFTRLCGSPPMDNTPPRKGEYDTFTPLGLMREGPWGNGLYFFASTISKMVIHFSPEKEANKHAAIQAVSDMPFKNIVNISSGIITPGAAAELLKLCNGKINPFPFLINLFKRPLYKRRKKKLD